MSQVGAAKTSVWRESWQVFTRGSVKRSDLRRVIVLAAAMIVILIANVLGEVRMNRWQGAFFSAVEKRHLSETATQSFLFLLIVSVLLTLVVSQNWILERLKIRLRAGLTHSLLDRWMKPGQVYRLGMTYGEELNPDQRIQEDVKHFSELTGDLGLGLARSTLMLLSFIGVLWTMSSGISIPVNNLNIVIPGYMVWVAVLYAAIGSWMAGRAGKPLIDLNEERYTREANFRYGLVRINENAESIGLYSGEGDERLILNTGFNQVLDSMRRLSFANARLTWVACGHGWMVVILPVLVALPGYMQGKLDFGGLMMAVGAFNQVQQSLRWFVENYGRIADWRATLQRVAVFQNLLAQAEKVQTETIAVVPHAAGCLSFEQTSINLVDGEVVIADATASIHPGERVMLVGDSGSGKSTLLRAIGGLWPWGSGRISIPPKSDTMFLPQKPYIPLGTLAEALAYPKAVTPHSQSAMHAALNRVNLEELIPFLHKKERWDKILSLGQQQRVAFARLLLHKPHWVFLDEATSALDERNQENVMSIFARELHASALISIGHRAGLEVYHNRILHLCETKLGRVLQDAGDLAKPRLTVVPRLLSDTYNEAARSERVAS